MTRGVLNSIMWLIHHSPGAVDDAEVHVFRAGSSPIRKIQQESTQIELPDTVQRVVNRFVVDVAFHATDRFDRQLRGHVAFHHRRRRRDGFVAELLVVGVEFPAQIDLAAAGRIRHHLDLTETLRVFHAGGGNNAWNIVYRESVTEGAQICRTDRFHEFSRWRTGGSDYDALR